MAASLPRRVLACFLSFSLLLMGMPQLALAGTIDTETFLATQRADQTPTGRLQDLLAREDVAKQMRLLGVDPAAVADRVAALSPEEVRTVQGHLDSLPAGGSALAVVGVVFVVLLILELVGITNVFTKV